MELPDVAMLARVVGARTTRNAGSAYPRALEKFSAEELRALGSQVSRADPHPAQDDRADLHRQDA